MTVLPPSSQPLETSTASDALGSLLATCIGFLVLNTLFVAARFFTSIFLRRSKAQTLWWDDYLTIPAYLCNLGIIIIALEIRKVYVHAEPPISANEWVNPEVNPLLYPTFTALLKRIYALTVLLIPVYILTRLSIIALYLRIFNGRIVRAACYTLGALILIEWLACQIVAILLCHPIHKFWDRNEPGGHYVDLNTFFRGISYPTLVLDVGLIALPLPSVWRLRMSRARRIALSALFLTSILAVIASAYRTSIVQTHDANFLTPAESNYWISWTIGETGIYLIVACLPALAPLFRLLIPSRFRGEHPRHSRHLDVLARQNGLPHRGDLARLVEHDASARAIGMQKGQLTPGEIELGERARTPGGGPKVDDLLGMQAGTGVLVHTEVMVTEEEKVADVIGI
ncbi:MAG: hypothetical protein Q9159_002757 [Coniocarpon cinnabarinum]